MKSKLLIYSLPVLFAIVLLYGFSTQDNPLRFDVVNPVGDSRPTVHHANNSSALLWDNTAINSTTAGIVSLQLRGKPVDSSYVQTADDFVVPVGVNWTIDSLLVRGLYSAGSTAMDSLGVQVFADSSGTASAIPTATRVILPNRRLTGDTLSRTLSSPIVLAPGRYWLSVYGIYNTSTTLTTTRWNWSTGTLANQMEARLRDKTGIFGLPDGNWKTLSSLGVTNPSTYFLLYGTAAIPPVNTTLVMFHDSTVVTGLAKRMADRDSVVKWLPSLISNYDITYFNQTTVLPSLAGYKTIILVETSFDNSGALCLGPGSRTDIKNWLSSGTTINKKALISIGGDQAYNYERAASANVDTTFARGFCGFIYRLDSGMPSPATMTGLLTDIGNTRNLLAPVSAISGYWPDGVSTTSGGLPVYKYGNHTAVDTLAAVSKNVGTTYFTVTSFQDPRYFINGDLRPWLAALISYAKNNGGTITTVTPQISSVAEKYSLSQNYPNPFNPTTKINFAIPSNGLVSLKIYDIAGKEVMTLVNKNMSVGSYSVEFNGALLSSGAYFYRLESGSFVETKKMMLVK
ncbi:hypothetical protein BH10BAC5_BH10BAC5_11870 [soil metagenome]